MIGRTCVTKSSKKPHYFFSYVLLALAFVCLSSSAFSQEESNVQVTVSPATIEDGDEISLSIEHGTNENPVEDVLSVSYTIAYEGFDIDEILSDPESLFEEESWFANDDNYVVSVSYSNSLSEIYIDLYRTDDNPRSGEGYAVGGGGLMVEIEDVILKKENPPMVKVTGVETRRGKLTFGQLEVDLMYNPTLETIQLFPGSNVELSRVRILTLGGQVIKEDHSGADQISLTNSASGMYIVDVQSTDGRYVRKKIYKY